MAELFRLPKMGQTMTEATILRWLKQEGESVEGWEGIVEMMTDKVNMEVEPQVKGTIRKILAQEGEVVPVGGPIAIIGAPDEDISALVAEAAAGARTDTDQHGRTRSSLPAPSAPSAPSATTEFPSVSPRAREAAAQGGLEWKSLSLPGTGFEGMIVERDVLAHLQSGPPAPPPTPLAARIAADLGVSVGEVPGTGPRGRVTAEDVRRVGSRRRAVEIEAREIPLTGMRKVIAGRLSASWMGAVHVPLRVDVDMSAAADLRRQLKPELEPMGARLTYTDLIAAAAVQALLQFPVLNATLEGDVVRIRSSVNLGVAVALDDGLTVPVVPDAQNLPLPELSLAIRNLAAKARAGQLKLEQFAGGTFTLTNLGPYGVDSFDPIINPPQVAILGTGRIQERVVAVAGVPAVRPMLTVTVTFDHRALDGAPAAMFLAKVKELLENPARLLL